MSSSIPALLTDFTTWLFGACLLDSSVECTMPEAAHLLDYGDRLRLVLNDWLDANVPFTCSQKRYSDENMDSFAPMGPLANLQSWSHGPQRSHTLKRMFGRWFRL